MFQQGRETLHPGLSQFMRVSHLNAYLGNPGAARWILRYMAEHATEILKPDVLDLQHAAQILDQGGVIALPTETVYGLGADARNDRAIATVYATKGRPRFNPLIVHVTDIETATRYAVFSDLAYRVANRFWPGPMSLVLPLKPGHGLSDLVTAGLETVALRVPAHSVAQAVLKHFNGPIAAPSANPSGRVSPTTAQHVLQDMGGCIDAIIDGGACLVGLESTILKIEHDTVYLLRAGGVSLDDIEAYLGQTIKHFADPIKPEAPGQLRSHYAPHTRMRLHATDIKPDEILLGFGPSCHQATLNLSPKGDLIEAAANLFSYLRNIDAQAVHDGKTTIAVSPIPVSGLGLAINDRLKRAAAPKP